MSDIKYRSDIDGLRSMAVLPVVFNHSGFSFVPGGFIGVDIFFVISGFLITKIIAGQIDEGRFSIITFYERRARRILPALLSVLLVCIVVGWFILLPDEFKSLSKSTMATLLFSSNIWFFRIAGDYFSPSVLTEPLLHTWSLAVEEQFYLFFPLLLILLAARPRIWMLLALSLASLLLSVGITYSYPTANFYLLPTRIWELGIGALIAIGFFPVASSRLIANAASLIGILLIVLSVLLIDEGMPFPGLTAVPPCLGAALIIWSGQTSETAGGRLLGTPVLVWFGLISYSLYLWHWPVLVAARIITNDMQLALPTATLCICLSIALAWFSWRYIERPFRNAKTGRWASRNRIFQAAGISMAGIFALVGAIYVAKGVPSRLPQTASDMLTIAKTRSPIEVQCMTRKIGEAPCKLGDTDARPAYVIWGDSHAGAMLVGFDDVLKTKEESAVAFVKSACLPVPGLWRVDQGADHRCDENNADVLKQIEKDYRGATVILISRWAIATESERVAGEFGKPAVLARTGETPRPGEDGAMLMREGLTALTGRLTKTGFPLVILGGIPEQGKDVPNMFARAALLDQTNQLAQGWITSEEYWSRNANVMPILREVAEKFGARVIDPQPLMCDDLCKVQIETSLLYRDDDHLSQFGAIWLTQQIFLGSASSDFNLK